MTLSRLDGTRETSQGTRETDADGRISDFGSIAAGRYRLSFDVGAYYQKAFLARVTLDFEIHDPSRKYHIPLLMSPFSCASYRGS